MYILHEIIPTKKLTQTNFPLGENLKELHKTHVTNEIKKTLTDFDSKLMNLSFPLLGSVSYCSHVPNKISKSFCSFLVLRRIYLIYFGDSDILVCIQNLSVTKIALKKHLFAKCDHSLIVRSVNYTVLKKPQSNRQINKCHHLNSNKRRVRCEI